LYGGGGGGREICDLKYTHPYWRKAAEVGASGWEREAQPCVV
jgi:hypothetical protein